MIPKNIPDDINAEVLLSGIEEGSCKVRFNGPHSRNAYNDLVGWEQTADSSLMHLGRASIYNSLPEMMFHSVDRFDNLPEKNEKDRFKKECDALEKEIMNAHRFFAPVDLMLLQMRMKVREQLEVYARTDKVMIDLLKQVLSDLHNDKELAETVFQNRFVKQVLPFLPFCKTIRGNKTAITLMLRKVFKEEGLELKEHKEEIEFRDEISRYDDSIGDCIDDLFVGNTFSQQIVSYDISYWTNDEIDEGFKVFLDDIEVFRQFVQDYFFAVEDTLRFHICHHGESTCLADDNNYYYLNYNTYL